MKRADSKLKVDGRSISDGAAHAYYVSLMSSNKDTKKRILKNKDFRDLQRSVFRTIADEYVNGDSGVYISNIGYLCHILRPERTVAISRNGKNMLRSKTNGYLYRHVCLDFFPRGQFYHIGKELCNPLKIACRRRSYKGFVYKFYFREVSAFMAAFKKNIKRLRRKSNDV